MFMNVFTMLLCKDSVEKAKAVILVLHVYDTPLCLKFLGRWDVTASIVVGQWIVTNEH